MSSPVFEKAQKLLKQLPGLGHRSAERILLHLLVERPERREPLLQALREAGEKMHRCPVTGNLCEGEQCPIYSDPQRDKSVVAIVETVPDLMAMERSAAFRGTYHVLHGKLSPLQGVGPEHLNFAALRRRLESGEVAELILALGNDIESEATCHYIQDTLLKGFPGVIITRLGFGLPSGSGVTYADPATLRNALDSRRRVVDRIS